jgi:transcriptional regulator with XRE-family HTH domain
MTSKKIGKPYTTHLLRHLRTTIGTEIQEARRKKRMTLSVLAQQSGISEKLLDFYELGKGEITLEELLRVSCVLTNGTTLDSQSIFDLENLLNYFLLD